MNKHIQQEDPRKLKDLSLEENKLLGAACLFLGLKKAQIALTAINRIRDERIEAQERVKRLERALNKVAQWAGGDTVGPGFDAPYFARLARKALQQPTFRCGLPNHVCDQCCGKAEIDEVPADTPDPVPMKKSEGDK